VAPTNNRESFRGEGFAIDAEGNIYYEYDAIINKREPNGNHYPYVGSGTRGIRDGYRREAQFQTVWSMALLRDGNIYVSDEDAIRKVTLDGEVTTVATGLITDNPPDGPWDGNNFNFFLGLDIDPAGNLYVGYYANARVLKVSPAGEISEFYFSGGEWYPQGVAYRDGELFVFETGHSQTRGAEHFRVRKINADGGAVTLVESGRVISDASSPGSTPAAFTLAQNYPNPFNAGTTISFYLPKAQHVHLDIYSINGQHVTNLIHEVRSEGEHRIRWDGTDRGESLPSGVYVYRMIAGAFKQAKKLLLLK